MEEHKENGSGLSLERLKPDVDRRWLLLIAGLVWGGVGAMLFRLAMAWLSQETPPFVWAYVVSGGLLAAVINHWGFSKLAKENILRIQHLGVKACVFAFQRWSSYFLVVVMIALGRFVRSLPIPKAYLAILYIGIGGALFLASLNYLRVLIYRHGASIASD